MSTPSDTIAAVCRHLCANLGFNYNHYDLRVLGKDYFDNTHVGELPCRVLMVVYSTAVGPWCCAVLEDMTVIVDGYDLLLTMEDFRKKLISLGSNEEGINPVLLRLYALKDWLVENNIKQLLIDNLSDYSKQKLCEESY